ncbi:hypothetical protein R2F61_06685 [Mollicutes bacterium LVI A0078]|nr:hypothetical protein RZE84_06690 [Mollicutes bacterium LVI A0075]WOO90414.1 hypothetical protein R2F61_06685 [Mollicutes bacterium LVI A0078]
MNRKSILLFAVFAVVISSGFVFGGATTFSASNFATLPVSDNQYEFGNLQLSDLKDYWEELKTELENSSIAEFFEDYDFGASWDKWDSDKFFESIDDLFGNLNYEDLFNS